MQKHIYPWQPLCNRLNKRRKHVRIICEFFFSSNRFFSIFIDQTSSRFNLCLSPEYMEMEQFICQRHSHTLSNWRQSSSVVTCNSHIYSNRFTACDEMRHTATAHGDDDMIDWCLQCRCDILKIAVPHALLIQYLFAFFFSHSQFHCRHPSN